ncbi:MAG: PilZ domain-containing protein [Treponema sp.]|nr:PilZ domain-containing protein [Treponema sp.]MCL2251198.1 PilZ domain-containing protein [Treponema sp.]
MGTDFTGISLEPTLSAKDIIIFLIVMAVIIGVLIVVNAAKKGSSKGGKSGSSGGGFGGIFSTFTLHRIARNIGLSNPQVKMLDFVFKTDGVTDPEKSIATPALLDRHFRRAYRVIEQTSGNDAEVQKRLALLFSTRNLLESSPIGAISSSKQLKDDTVLTITHGNEKFEIAVVSSKEDNLIVETPKTVLGSHVKIPRGTRISVLFFTKSNKGFSFESRIVGYGSTQGIPTLMIAHSNQLRFLSQRRFRRRQSVIACFMFLVYVEGSGKKQRLIVDKRRSNGSIADISVGGCSIKTMSPIQVGAKFKIEFTQRDTNVAALGQVLRTNRTGMNTTIHVRFLRVSQKSMNIINAFVYEYAND